MRGRETLKSWHMISYFDMFQPFFHLQGMRYCQSHHARAEFIPTLHRQDSCSQDQEIPHKLQVDSQPSDRKMFGLQYNANSQTIQSSLTYKYYNLKAK